MKTEKILRASVLATLTAVSLSFAASPVAPDSTQTKCICQCNGIIQDKNQGADQPGSMNGGSITPSQQPEKKRPVDEVDWDRIFGETG